MDCDSWGLVAAIVLPIVGTIVGMFMWNRAESNADRREAAADRKDINNKIEATMKDTRALIDSNMKETREMINAIKEEIKDFHARLCVIESNRKVIINKDGHPL